jgi:hypothetical protein
MALREVVWSALFIALGLTIPVLFHTVGLGAAFLPMFLPILAAGLLLRSVPAALIGLVTPPLSALLTGMPPLMPPVAFVMAVEGVILGALSSFLYRRLQWNIFLTAAAAVLVQRTVMILLTIVLAPLFGLPGPLAALGLLAQGLPGVSLLIFAVPLLIRYLEKTGRR